ncbi:hypothetical protein DKK70_11725 [Gilliamella apicola]|uniref:Uncharacterized protein n=2 Tax=Gilliamella apicola TaxID=1196095 RepID=A0A2V4E277_9GAMM|nr:hypothetical protein DKK70_11725 [Gilliamella apicola]
MLLITSYSSLALTAKTMNIINGNAPYLTFDGGRTQAKNTNGLLEISLSDGSSFTPSFPNSKNNPIVLPVAGQSFADIDMLVPTNTDSIALSSLIGPPYNYWGDDDGDGQGINGITATGSLSLSIVDRDNQPVARNTKLEICKGPYKLTLSNTSGSLKTRYGVPNESLFSASNVTYYINPKSVPEICFVRPIMSANFSSGKYAGPASIWDPRNGFLPQSVTPSSYGLNFPTTGANNLYFDLDIGGVAQPLTWKAVSANGDIKVTMTNSKRDSVRITLTGPVAKDSQWSLDNPGNIDKPSLPQVIELVGLDSNNNEVLKYGFVLKHWFVNRGNRMYTYASMSSWCTNIGYRLAKIKDLTNANYNNLGATPSSSGNHLQRTIGAGFFSEWSIPASYKGGNFVNYYYWTSDPTNFIVVAHTGEVKELRTESYGVCVYP